MRNPKRIKKIINKLREDDNLIKIIKYYLSQEELEAEPDKDWNKDEVLSEVEKFWIEHPDYRFTQVLISLSIIPNITGFWFYIEDKDAMVDSKIMKKEEIDW